MVIPIYSIGTVVVKFYSIANAAVCAAIQLIVWNFDIWNALPCPPIGNEPTMIGRIDIPIPLDQPNWRCLILFTGFHLGRKIFNSPPYPSFPFNIFLPEEARKIILARFDALRVDNALVRELTKFFRHDEPTARLDAEGGMNPRGFG